MRHKLWTGLCAAVMVLGFAACSNELKVSEASPATGGTAGGEEVIIEGGGFQPGRGGVTVKFGNHEAQSVVVESDSKIKVMSPAGDRNTTVDISVVFDDGKAFLIKNGFHYVDPQQASTMQKSLSAFGTKK